MIKAIIFIGIMLKMQNLKMRFYNFCDQIFYIFPKFPEKENLQSIENKTNTR
jgi:hypothetical protein